MTKRLFLGITLGKQQIRHIQQLQRTFSDDLKLIRATNLHMTLAFLGPVSCEQQQQLEQQITLMRKTKFTINLDTLAHWKKPKILCITASTQNKALQQLVDNCHQVANALNLTVSPSPYTAHITVARNAHCMPHCQGSFKTLRLSPTMINLFQSKSTDQGVQYTILHKWEIL